MVLGTMRRCSFLHPRLFFILLSTLVALMLSTPASALRIIVQPETTIGSATSVYWVREPSDPLPLFDLRFVVHGEVRDDGLAGANISFNDNSGGTSDGIRTIGTQVVQFPRAGRYVLVAVSGPNNEQIGTSNEIVVSAAPTITLIPTPTRSPTATSTSKPTPNTNTATSGARGTNKAPIIVGVLIGSILFVALVAVIILLFLKRRRMQQEQNRLSFHPEEMIQRRRSKWMTISRFSISRGGGAPAVDSDRAEVAAEARSREGSNFTIGTNLDVEAQLPGNRLDGSDEVVFDIDHHRKSAVSSIRTSLNSFSTESRSRYTGEEEAVQGAAAGLAMIAELLTPSTKSITIPPAPAAPPPKVDNIVRALPPIPMGPAFDEETLSSIAESRKSSVATTDSTLSGLTLDIPARPLPPPIVPTPTPVTARTPRPLPSPAVRPRVPPTPTVPQPATATVPPITPSVRALPPVPITPASALPFPPTPQTAIAFPTPTPIDIIARTPRQKLIDRRLSQVQSQLALLRKKLSRGQVDREVGIRVERDLEKQITWLQNAKEGSWAKDMSGGDDMKPEGWSRYMTP